MKHIPEINEKLYLYTPCYDSCVSDVRTPYTVEFVNGKKTECIVREARPVFLGVRYFDTLPDYIEDDPHGQQKKLRWSEKKQRWQESPARRYPKVAVFGEWDFAPYLN